MKYQGLTPIHDFIGFSVKREDLACWSDLDMPSGSKVRQYMAMAGCNALPDGTVTEELPCLVGCSADSAMQIYVAAAAKVLGTKAIVFTARRKVKSDATRYAERMGAEVFEVRPGHLSVIRSYARTEVRNLEGKVIQWNRTAAIEDTILQCDNVDFSNYQRVIVPTGSGLTAAGVLAGIARQCRGPFGRKPEVVIVATSPMADGVSVTKLATQYASGLTLPLIRYIAPRYPYSQPITAKLPDGTPLDPFYAAKAYDLLDDGCLLWPPGLRPVSSMPEECRNEFGNWQGPID